MASLHVLLERSSWTDSESLGPNAWAFGLLQRWWMGEVVLKEDISHCVYKPLYLLADHSLGLRAVDCVFLLRPHIGRMDDLFEIRISISAAGILGVTSIGVYGIALAVVFE